MLEGAQADNHGIQLRTSLSYRDRIGLLSQRRLQGSSRDTVRQTPTFLYCIGPPHCGHDVHMHRIQIPVDRLRRAWSMRLRGFDIWDVLRQDPQGVRTLQSLRWLPDCHHCRNAFALNVNPGRITGHVPSTRWIRSSELQRIVLRDLCTRVPRTSTGLRSCVLV
jgi:hypothetical protein